MTAVPSWRCMVPVPLVAPDGVEREDYAEVLARVGADCVLLWGPSPRYPNPAPLEHFAALRDLLRESIPFFESRGIAVGFWMGHTLGHWGDPAPQKPPFQHIVGPTGKEVPGCLCPADAAFRKHVVGEFALIAESGVGLILIDDDFRMCWRAPDAQVGCFCPLHLRAFAERCGRELSLDEVVRATWCGRPSELRRLWLETQGQFLMDFAAEIEHAVHSVNPRARIGLCATMGHSGGQDGVDLVALLRRLAGGTRPFLRTIGAPYWSKEPSHVAWVTEYTRLQAHWLRGTDAELIAEGDTFPHTRFHCSAAMLHAYHQFLIASGFPGMLNYPIVYDKHPRHEPAFVDKTERSLAHYAAIREFVPVDYAARGVTLVEEPCSLAHFVLPVVEPQAINPWANDSASLRSFSRLGIPIAYDDDSGPVAIVGQTARLLPDERLDSLLARGALLDGVAATWLMERGFDIGLRTICPAPAPRFERFAHSDLNGAYRGVALRYFARGSDIFFRCEPADGAVPLGDCLGFEHRFLYPGPMVFENARTQRFCILPFDLARAPWAMTDYARQEQLARCLAWLNRRPLPATMHGQADVHLLCRAARDGSRIVIAVQNAHLDAIEKPVFRLRADIPVPERIELLLHDAAAPLMTSDFDYRAEGDYGHLALRHPVPPMGFVAVALRQG